MTAYILDWTIGLFPRRRSVAFDSGRYKSKRSVMRLLAGKAHTFGHDKLGIIKPGSSLASSNLGEIPEVVRIFVPHSPSHDSVMQHQYYATIPAPQGMITHDSALFSLFWSHPLRYFLSASFFSFLWSRCQGLQIVDWPGWRILSVLAR